MTEHTQAQASERECKQVPLIELLSSVPHTARLVIEEGPYSTRYIPVGRYCHEAAAALASRSTEPGGEAPWHDESKNPVSFGEVESHYDWDDPAYNKKPNWNEVDALASTPPPTSASKEAAPAGELVAKIVNKLGQYTIQWSSRLKNLPDGTALYTSPAPTQPPAAQVPSDADIVDAVIDPNGTCPTCHQYLRTDARTADGLHFVNCAYVNNSDQCDCAALASPQPASPAPAQALSEPSSAVKASPDPYNACNSYDAYSLAVRREAIANKRIEELEDLLAAKSEPRAPVLTAAEAEILRAGMRRLEPQEVRDRARALIDRLAAAPTATKGAES